MKRIALLLLALGLIMPLCAEEPNTPSPQESERIVCPYYHGVALFKVNNSLGLIDSTGHVLVRPIYASAPTRFGDAQFCRKTNYEPIEWYSWVGHPRFSNMWIDSKGKILVQGTRAMFFVGDMIPEALWDY